MGSPQPVSETAAQISVVVDDNGIGLPSHGRERLTEPYVTTRAKGTGLGLAIVKKIVEDQGGELMLEDGEGVGARVSLVFAVETRANERGFVRIGKDCGERCVDVFIGDTAASQLARDAVTSLAAALCVMAGVFEGVASVVEVVQFAEAGDDGVPKMGE